VTAGGGGRGSEVEREGSGITGVGGGRGLELLYFPILLNENACSGRT
jgi:hypothetical protein